MLTPTIIVKFGQFIPDSERWLHTKENMEKLDAAIHWAETNERRENFEDIIAITDYKI